MKMNEQNPNRVFLINKIFSANLKAILTFYDWSFTDLYKNCDNEIGYAYIHRLKNSSQVNPTLQIIEVLAKHLHVTPMDLIDPNFDIYKKFRKPKTKI